MKTVRYLLWDIWRLIWVNRIPWILDLKQRRYLQIKGVFILYYQIIYATILTFFLIFVDSNRNKSTTWTIKSEILKCNPYISLEWIQRDCNKAGKKLLQKDCKQDTHVHWTCIKFKETQEHRDSWKCYIFRHWNRTWRSMMKYRLLESLMYRILFVIKTYITCILHLNFSHY